MGRRCADTVNYLLDGFHHRQSHVNTQGAVVLGLYRGTGNTIVAVAQDLNSQLVVLLGQPIEACKQLVEHLHQVRSRVLGRDGREADNVSVQDAGIGN